MAAEKRVQLTFENLCERHPGISPGISAGFDEATQVCLDRHHASPVTFEINRGSSRIEVDLYWLPAQLRLRRAWGNDIDATEAAACAIVLAAIEVSDNLVALGRAETRTGADYYLGRAGGSEDLTDFECCFRLEVSGVDKGDLATVKARLREKVRQAACGKSNIPAIASVVGLLQKIVLIEDVVL